jgi:glycerol-3-phosphate acyltransferase PlsY
MMNATTIYYALAFGLLGYLCGSLPFSIWITRLVRGVDVRAAGSGHATATNTIRQAGFAPGFLVFTLDLAKGFLPTWLAFHFAPAGWIAALAASLAVAGHCWPLFAGFRGGMGLATTGGGLLAVAPSAFLACLVLLVVLLLVLRHAARAGALTGVLMLPLFWLVGLRDTVLWLALGAGMIIAARFLSDWKRRYRELWLDREKKTA